MKKILVRLVDLWQFASPALILVGITLLLATAVVSLSEPTHLPDQTKLLQVILYSLMMIGGGLLSFALVVIQPNTVFVTDITNERVTFPKGAVLTCWQAKKFASVARIDPSTVNPYEHGFSDE